MEMSTEEPPDGGGGLPPDKLCRPLKRPADNDLIKDSDGKKTRSPAESIQSVYCKPGYESDSKFHYTDSDKGPYTVFVSRQEPDSTSGYSFKILKFAHFLHRNNISGIKEGGIKNLGRNKISIDFTTAENANNFLKLSILANNKYTAYIPRFQIVRMGVVRDIPTDWSLEEFLEGIHTPTNCGEVIRARRLNVKSRKEDSIVWIPSNSVVLTFLGQHLPEKVYCFNAALPVSIYQLPTIQCRNCCRFGHIAKQCRSQPRCYKCAKSHPGDNCSTPDVEVSCLLCSGSHKATDVKCPEHDRQKSIKLVMSQENINYLEASARFPQSKRLYSEAVTRLQSPPLSQSTTVTASPTSYKKTVFLPPRPKPVLGKSYDLQAHSSIVNAPPSSQPNGCALLESIETTPLATPNDNLVELLLCSLINMLSKFSDSLPNNVSVLVEQLLTVFARNNTSNGSPNPPVELQKY